MKQRGISISVDWDFFFPSIDGIHYDYGHQETMLFIRDIWHSRASNPSNPMKTLIPQGHKEFWNRLDEYGIKPECLLVHESHLYSMPVLMPVNFNLLLVFDQHFDIYGNDGEHITCENWLYQLLMSKKHADKSYPMENLPYVIVFKPSDLTDEEKETLNSLPIDVKGRIEIRKFSEFDEIAKKLNFKEYSTRFGFVARSGAWTPPWADKEFLGFLNSSGAKWKEYEKGLVKRSFDIKIVETLRKQLRRQMLESQVKE